MKCGTSTFLAACRLLIIIAVTTAAHAQDAGQPIKWIEPEIMTTYAPFVPKPTQSNIRYGEHERHILDFWQASSDRPTPLVLVIHGGSWSGNNKEIVHRSVDVAVLLQEGISVVAINYRYLSHAIQEGIEPPIKAPLHDAARALQFVRSKAGEWNLDKRLFGAAGVSAGGTSSLWLAYHDDLADPKSKDPVARESTRLWCAAVKVPLTSFDPQQMKDWTPNASYDGLAFGKHSFAEFLAERESILPWIPEYSPLALVSPDDPPVYMSYRNPPALGQDQKDPIHTANSGVKLQERCKQVGIGCELAYPGAPDVKHQNPTDYLIASFKASGASRK